MKTAFILAAFLAVTLLVFFVQRRNLPVAKIITNSPAPSSGHTTYFVYAKILDTVLPLERNEKYSDPLDTMLQKRHFGEVTGGGTMQRKDKTIEYVGLDLELTDLNAALDATKTKLRELGAPTGSVLEFQHLSFSTMVKMSLSLSTHNNPLLDKALQRTKVVGGLPPSSAVKLRRTSPFCGVLNEQEQQKALVGAAHRVSKVPGRASKSVPFLDRQRLG